MSDAKAKKEVKAEGKKKNSKALLYVLALCFAALSMLFMSVSLILIIGMIPTVIALLVNPPQTRIRALTIGAMNLAGCTPFLMEIAQNGLSLEHAVGLMIKPLTIVIIFSAAAMGYMIDWAVSGIASVFLYQKALARREDIHKKQKELTERWGENVSGEMVLDEYGFALGSS